MVCNYCKESRTLFKQLLKLFGLISCFSSIKTSRVQVSDEDCLYIKIKSLRKAHPIKGVHWLLHNRLRTEYGNVEATVFSQLTKAY